MVERRNNFEGENQSGYALTGRSLVEEDVIGYVFSTPDGPVEHLIGVRSIISLNPRSCTISIAQPNPTNPSEPVQKVVYDWTTHPYTTLRLDSDPSLT